MTLDAVMVPDTNVAALMDFDAWASVDAKKTIDANPAAFGVTRGALADLHATGVKRDDAQIIALAESLGERMGELRRRAYSAIDDDASPDTRISLRARSLALAVEATTAVVTAQAGAAMQSGCNAERRVREAMFLQVQAQTAATRAASLALLQADG